VRLLFVAALACFIIALAIVLGSGAIAGTGYLAWLIGGFIAIVLAWLVGPYIDGALGRQRAATPPQ
jgi:hypothetical protein